jgi:pectate lyase
MKKLFAIVIILLSYYTSAFSQPLAFPTAEGGGKFATGGRGGRVIIVTNLNDSGEGSFRDAIDQSGPRIVLFAVDGTIDLKSKLILKYDSITIAGQSAPGEGICLKGYPFYLKANNIIIRYIRARMGDINAIEDDAFGGRYIKNIMVDHCSFSWSVDECLSLYASEDLTVQWCIISHSLSKTVHSKGAHGFGGIWGGSRATFHHNLIANHSSRNPRFGSDGYSPVDFRNNVVYNWGYKAAYGGGRKGRINFVANYYKPGPATIAAKRTCFLDAADDKSGMYYLSGNTMVGSAEVTADNWKGVQQNKTPEARADNPFPVMPINQQTAEMAYESVLKNAGCSYRRDSYDTRVIEEVYNGTATAGETFGGGGKGIIDSQNAVGGWPILKKGKPKKDTDNDGMPDWWEKKNNLNCLNPKDNSGFDLSSEYSNIEIYLNELTK